MNQLARTGRAVIFAIALSACGAAPGGSATAPSSLSPTPQASIPSSAPGSPDLSNVGDFSVASILGTTLDDPPSATAWHWIADPAAPFRYEAPSTWDKHLVAPIQEGGNSIGTVLAAASEPSRLGTDFSVPGIAIGVSANPSGATPRQALAAEDYSTACTPGEVRESTDATIRAASQLWEQCGSGQSGLLLVMALVPLDGAGLVTIVFQGASEADLVYLEHILGSLGPATAVATAGPGPTSASTAGTGIYTISMDLCQNQHGQGVAEGLIRNDDVLVHAFRVYVTFFDPNGVLLTDTDGLTPDIPPGVTAKWQAVVPSGLPSASVTCQVTDVKVVR